MYRTAPLLLLLVADQAFAAITKVSAGGLKSAISSASSGDTLLLEAGTFTECVRISKTLTVIGQGPALTTIDCDEGSATALDIASGASVVISGLSITNGAKLPVKVTSASATFMGIEIDDATATTSGGAMRISGSNVEIVSSLFDGNVVTAASTSAQGGGAISITGGSSVQITGTTFSNNSVTNSAGYAYGGALYVEQSSLTLRGVTISGNSAQYGGGMYMTASTSGTYYPYLYDTAFEDNSATADGGGLYLSGAVYAQIYQSTLSGNSAGTSGGALYADQTTTFYDSTVSGNSATSGGGFYGKFYAGYRSTFSGNTATSGGALYIPEESSGGYSQINSNADVFDSNIATSNGGAIYTEGNYNYIRNALVSSNTATNGGGIAHVKGYMSIEQSEISGNDATTAGGGLGVASGVSYCNTQDTLFESNTASGTSGTGGAVAVAGTFYATGVEFSSNSATTYGGGVYVETDSPSIQFSTGTSFHDNSAQYGGGLATISSRTTSSAPYISSTWFHDNTASKDGAAVYSKNQAFYMYYSWVYENTGSTSGAIYLSSPYSWYLQQDLICANSASAGSGGGMSIKTQYYGGSVYWTAFVENTAKTYGGAVYSDGYTASVGSSGSSWQNDIFVGNYSSTPGYDNHVGANGVYLYMYDNVFQGNGSYALSGVGSTKPHYFWGNLFYDHATTYVYLDNSTYASTTYKNYVVNPTIKSWSEDGDCFNDTLTLGSAVKSTYTGNSGYGVGLEGTMGSTGMHLVTDDNDGDGVSTLQGDCDDYDATVYKDAKAVAYSYSSGTGYRDEDCVGAYDYDADGDGFDSTYAGYTDCDDSDASVYPGATDSDAESGKDYDCDGYSSDADHDGYSPSSLGGSDCDDADPAINPGVPDAYYDGVDANCDGYDADVDGDGHEYPGTDCDDSNPNANDDIVEIYYDGLDGNCDGQNDYDQDNDGDLRPADGGTDCDDTDAQRSGQFVEVWYDSVDGDCDGWDDFDQDHDGQRSKAEFAGGTDCNDEDPLIYKDAPERVNGLDDDCDGEAEKDSDGDSILDPVEKEFNPDSTGWQKKDTDNDGLNDGVEWGPEPLGAPVDSDEDGLADILDNDSDNDLVEDKDEHVTMAGEVVDAPVNNDDDIFPDWADDDDDNDKIPTKIEGNTDADGDGLANRIDVDSDNDGSKDEAELQADNDGDGVLDYLEDGTVADLPSGETEPKNFGFGCSSSGAPAAGALAALALALVRRRRG